MAHYTNNHIANNSQASKSKWFILLHSTALDTCNSLKIWVAAGCRISLSMRAFMSILCNVFSSRIAFLMAIKCFCRCCCSLSVCVCFVILFACFCFSLKKKISPNIHMKNRVCWHRVTVDEWLWMTTPTINRTHIDKIITAQYNKFIFRTKNVCRRNLLRNHLCLSDMCKVAFHQPCDPSNRGAYK